MALIKFTTEAERKADAKAKAERKAKANANRKAAELRNDVANLINDHGSTMVVKEFVEQGVGTDAFIDAIVERNGGSINEVVESLVESHGGRKAVVNAFFGRSGIDTYVLNEIVEALVNETSEQRVVNALTRSYGSAKRIAGLLPVNVLQNVLTEDELLSVLRSRASDEAVASKLDGHALREAFVSRFPNREWGVVELLVKELTAAERGAAEAELVTVVNAFRNAEAAAKDAAETAAETAKAAESATKAAQNAVKVSITAAEIAEAAERDAMKLAKDSPLNAAVTVELNRFTDAALDLNEEAEVAETRRAEAKDAAAAAAETAEKAKERLEEALGDLREQTARVETVRANIGRFAGEWRVLTDAKALLPVEDDEVTEETEATDDSEGDTAPAESEVVALPALATTPDFTVVAPVADNGSGAPKGA